MSRQILKALLALALIGGIVSYLFYYNPAPVSVVLGKSQTWQAPMALVILVVFGLGCVFSGLLAFVFNLRNSFALWKERRRDRVWKSHREAFMLGREHMAVHEFESAKVTFRRMIEEDPENVLARTELARALEKSGEVNEALKVLDTARQTEHRNVELLMTAALTNLKSGNLTAAYDNLVLVLQNREENPFALETVVEVATKLGKFEEAIEYQKRLIRRLSGREDIDRAQNALAALELQLADAQNSETDAQKTAVEEVLRRHRDYAPALGKLAQLQRDSGNADAASKLWLKAYGLTGDVTYLRDISGYWLSRGEPSKALGSVKTALESFKADALDASGRLFLIQFLLHLEMLDEAEDQLKKLQAQGGIPPRLAIEKAFLKCKIGLRRGKADEAIAGLLEVLERHSKFTDSAVVPLAQNNGTLSKLRSPVSGLSRNQEAKPPSPRLSTP